MRATGFFFIVALAIVGAFRLVRIHMAGGNIWITGDWIINYEGGFVRRGLAGEMLALVAGIVNLDLTVVTGLFLAVLWLLTCSAILMIWASAPTSVGRLMVLVSPAFLAFQLWDFQGAARKELLLFAFVSWLLVASRKLSGNPVRQWLWILAFTICPPLLMLTHELTLFAVPFLLLILSLVSKEAKLTSAQQKFSLIGLGSSVIFAAIAIANYSGNIEQQRLICESIQLQGGSDRLCTGALSWVGLNPSNALGSTAAYGESLQSIATYAALIGLSLIPFLLFKSTKFWRSWSHGNALVFASVGLLPLFALGLDWGRWIHIGATMGSIIVLRFAEVFHTRPLSVRLLTRHHVSLNLLLVSLFAFGWSIDHFVGGNNSFPGPLRLAEDVGLLSRP